MSSLRRVAEHAEVSIATVSRVLNNTGGKAYSAATADRVRAAVAELGYRPNLLERIAGNAAHSKPRQVRVTPEMIVRESSVQVG